MKTGRARTAKQVEYACDTCGTEFWYTTVDGYVPPQVLCPPCREAELEEMDRINEAEMWGPNARPCRRRVL